MHLPYIGRVWVLSIYFFISIKHQVWLDKLYLSLDRPPNRKPNICPYTEETTVKQYPHNCRPTPNWLDVHVAPPLWPLHWYGLIYYSPRVRFITYQLRLKRGSPIIAVASHGVRVSALRPCRSGSVLCPCRSGSSCRHMLLRTPVSRRVGR